MAGGPRRIGAAIVTGVLAVVAGGCRSSVGGERTADRPAAAGGGTVVVVPSGARVTKLSFAPGGPSPTAEVEPSDPGAAIFPLLAYRRFCDGVRPEDFDLVSPRLVIDLRLADGRTERLPVGGANFTGAGTYVLEPESACVALVTTSSVHRLARLAGEAAAAPFRPPTDGRPAVEGEPPVPDPAAAWVEQAQRARSRTTR